MPRPGRQIGASLRLVRELARGGMGSVWIADHLGLRTQVAVKFLAERSRLVPNAVARFTLEATAAARIRSPHVVQVFDHGISEGTPYIVMELLEGEDLAARLARVVRLSPEQTSNVIEQVCRALERAHASGIVHRDIKPANVFLTPGPGDELVVKVLDFGLAKHEHEASGSLAASASAFGTPYYVSPEQAGSPRTAKPQADLWSLAVMAYECLTGQRPFQAESLMGLCLALKAGRFAPPTSLRPELSPAIDAWFARALQRDPSHRFASARELSTTFAAALFDDEAPISRTEEAPPTSVEARSSSMSVRRRRARAAWAWGALATIGVSAIFFAPRFARHAETPPRAAPQVDDAPAPSIDPLQAPPAPSPAAITPTAESTALVAATPAPSSSGPARRPPRASPSPHLSSTVPSSSDDLFADPKK